MKSAQKEKRLTNPNKVNQFTPPDPRQTLFLTGYLVRESPTFGNAFQSAIAAGYAESYAEVIRNQETAWLSENLSNLADESLLRDLGRHYGEIMNLSIKVPAMGAFGPIFQKSEKMVKVKLKDGKTKLKKVVTKTPLMVISTSVIKEKTNVAKILSEGIFSTKYGKKNQGGAPSAKFVFNFKSNKDKYAA
jgi:hypothetical protein